MRGKARSGYLPDVLDVSGPNSEISPRLDASSCFIHAPARNVAATAKMQITRFIRTTSQLGCFRPLRFRYHGVTQIYIT